MASSATLNGDFTCACEDEARAACVGEPRFGEFEDKEYCILHLPAKKSAQEFNQAIKRKLETPEAKVFDFGGVWFPDGTWFKQLNFTGNANFGGATFSTKASFNSAVFSGQADFSNVTFQGKANFNDATFEQDATFSGARFLGVGAFINATFEGNADFSYSEFCEAANFDTYFLSEVDFLYAFFRSEAYFRYAEFSARVSFRSVTFQDYLRFGGEELGEGTSLDFQYARVHIPERVAFHSLRLRPHWFVNVDARKFDLINIDWDWPNLSIEAELKGLHEKKVATPHRLLAIAFQNLASNAEENQRFEEASRFRYLSSELWRKNEPHDSLTSVVGWLYWAASGYGERMLRAFIVLAGIWLLFGAFYSQVGFDRAITTSTGESVSVHERDQFGLPLRRGRALVYSLETMTLQKPEPRPLTTVAQVLVLVETILGPVQAALLALAIRRRFMR